MDARRLWGLFKHTAQLLLHEVVFGRHVDLVLLLSCLHFVFGAQRYPGIDLLFPLFAAQTKPGLFDKDIDSWNLGWLEARVGG